MSMDIVTWEVPGTGCSRPGGRPHHNPRGCTWSLDERQQPENGLDISRYLFVETLKNG